MIRNHWLKPNYGVIQPSKSEIYARDREGAYFDQEHATRAISFLEKYAVPSTVGRPIRLLDWQRDFVSRFYGWRKPDGHRLYRRAILSTGKKQGKTVLQSGILLYELLGGVQTSPFCVSASTTRENAGQLYRELVASINHNPKLKKLVQLRDSYKEVRIKSKSARYRAFSADAGAAEGENISACVVDELHAHQSDELFRSLEYSTVARPDGALIIISTAGTDQSSLWFDLFTYAQRVQAGEIIDTGLLPAIYTTPDDADLDNPATWKLANPSLGTSFSEDDFRRDWERAKAGGVADTLTFRRYRFNQWTQAEAGFIDGSQWDRCREPMTDEQLRPFPLFVGCDWSQTTDPSSIGMVWALPDRRFYVRSHSFVCQEGVKKRESTNLPKYQEFRAAGDMTIQAGGVIDYRQLKLYLQGLKSKFKVKEITFDQYNALETYTELQSQGWNVTRTPQTHRYFTSPIKDFASAVSEKRILHDGGKLLKWALMNCRLDVDKDGNSKFAKDKSTDKIDPAVSVVMAFGRAVENNASNQQTPSVYRNRGVIVI